MIKIKVMWGRIMETEWQDKSFKDEAQAIEWCRKHADWIGCINNYRTSFQPISHFEIMDAIRGKEN